MSLARLYTMQHVAHTSHTYFARILRTFSAIDLARYELWQVTRSADCRGSEAAAPPTSASSPTTGEVEVARISCCSQCQACVTDWPHVQILSDRLCQLSSEKECHLHCSLSMRSAKHKATKRHASAFLPSSESVAGAYPTHEETGEVGSLWFWP